MRFYVFGLLALLTGCGTKVLEKPKEAPRLPRITHFYGNSTVVPKGESLTLCYGTENVDVVRITPSDEGELKGVLNRCIAHTPAKDTTYVMKAQGPGGETTATFSVRIGAAAAAAGNKERVLIQNFQVLGNSPVAAGARVQLCYSTDGAADVSVRPTAEARLAPGKNQCFVVSPAKTTNYVLTARAADGSVDRMQVTVAVQ